MGLFEVTADADADHTVEIADADADHAEVDDSDDELLVAKVWEGEGGEQTGKKDLPAQRQEK